MINILSIDWDYFVCPKKEKDIVYYPDGHDFGIELSTFIWTNYYNDKLTERSSFKVKDIKINRKEMKFIQEYLQCARPYRTMVVNSHQHIYDFIKDNVDTNTEINLVNIDFHHDLYRHGKELDCGNWFKYIMREYPKTSKYTWIHRDISNMKDMIYKSRIKMIDDLYSLNNIMDVDQVDFIFVCKSYIWSPPHLDKYFNQCFKPIMDKCLIQMKEDKIFVDRYKKIKEYLDDPQHRDIDQIMMLHNEFA